ncbi:MAG: LytTR family DNA-binding domain-containing protein [Flavipsychrobacter sp.]|nr:LytTR family DNA-binding domain-containing protein [Flavipsychrobacter sp.]
MEKDKITTIVIDDEQDCRNSLKKIIAKYCPLISVVGEGNSVEDAIILIHEHEPRLVFLDINMPNEDGFKIFSRIPNPSFQVVFVTAYDQFALKALRHGALDYILKPISIDDLILTVEKVKKRIDQQTVVDNFDTLIRNISYPNTIPKIALPVSDGLVYVNIQDVVRCEAEANYTFFYFTDNSKILVCHTLGSFEEKLKPMGFVRVHHHHLINKAFVRRYQKGRGGIITMSDKKEIVVSQRKKNEFLNAILDINK